VLEPDRVPKFVCDNIPENVGHCEWPDLCVFDRDEAAISYAGGERHELCVGEHDEEIPREGVEGRRMLAKPRTSKRPSREPRAPGVCLGKGLKVGIWEFPDHAINGSKPKRGPLLVQRSVPEIDRFSDDGKTLVSCGRDHRDVWNPAPSVGRPDPWKPERHDPGGDKNSTD